MCGIFGFINASGSRFHKAKTIIEELVIIDSLRGTDGTGLAVLPEKKDSIMTYKRAMWGPEFLTTNGYQKGISHAINNARMVIGHNRAATRNSHLADDNAHPFTNRNITLVHNGFISNAYAITPKDFGPEVDSEAAAWALAEYEAPEALGKLNGAFALVWHDSLDNTMNVARNDGRELHCIYLKDLDTMFFASEWMMLHLSLKRNDINLDGKYRVVPAFQHIKFELDKPREYTKVPFVEARPSYTQQRPWERSAPGPTVSPTTVTPPTITAGTSPRGLLPGVSHTSRSPEAAELTELHTRFQKLSRTLTKGACIPSSKGKIRGVYERLSVKGFKLGQTLLLKVASYETYPNQRNHGVLYLDRASHEGLDVRIPNIEAKVFAEMKTRPQRGIYGTIVNMKRDKKTHKEYIVCALEGVASVTERPVLKLASDLKEEETLQDKLQKLDASTTTIIEYVPGPGGSLIELGQFMALTSRHGCGNCGCFLNPNEATEMTWVDSTAICPHCSELRASKVSEVSKVAVH